MTALSTTTLLPSTQLNQHTYFAMENAPNQPIVSDYDTLEKRIRSIGFLLRIIQTAQQGTAEDTFAPLRSASKFVPPQANRRSLIDPRSTLRTEQTKSPKTDKWLRLLDYLAILLVRSEGAVVATGASMEAPGNGRYLFFTESPRNQAKINGNQLNIIDCTSTYKASDAWAHSLFKDT